MKVQRWRDAQDTGEKNQDNSLCRGHRNQKGYKETAIPQLDPRNKLKFAWPKMGQERGVRGQPSGLKVPAKKRQGGKNNIGCWGEGSKRVELSGDSVFLE